MLAYLRNSNTDYSPYVCWQAFLIMVYTTSHLNSGLQVYVHRHVQEKAIFWVLAQCQNKSNILTAVKVKGKVIPLQAQRGTEGGQRYSSTLP